MKRRFSLVFYDGDDGKLHCDGKNSGYNIFEVLGLLEWKKRDFFDQLSGDIKPDIVTRTVIKEEA